MYWYKDGPVDAVWIENLNSVLDDNKTLTLANGDRIVMAPNCKLVFEPDNVDNASPATVSRMGMTFFSASVMKWSPILDGITFFLKIISFALFSSCNKNFNDFFYLQCYLLLGWLKTRQSDEADTLKAFFYKNNIYDEMHTFVQTKLKAKMKILEAIYIRQCCDILQGLLLDEISRSNAYMERLFLFALMWSLGAVLELDDRDQLARFALTHPSKMSKFI